MLRTKAQNKSNKKNIEIGDAHAQGITLITLVITIIIMLILATVAINLTLGDNGIFTKAKEAREKMEIATIKEQIQMDILTEQLGNNGKISNDKLEEIFSKYGDVKKDEEENITGVKPEGKEEIIPIEDIIGDNKVTEGDEGNSEEDVGGKYNTPYIPNGFAHTEGTWNTGYTIIGETKSIGNEFVWVPCVLTVTEQKVAQAKGDTVQIFQKTTTGKYNAKNLRVLPMFPSVQAEDSSVQDLEQSVGKYGGFYIAKYEAGIPGTGKSVTTDHNIPVTGEILPVSKPNVGVWNFIKRDDALSLSKKMINYEEIGVRSTLISGAAWDTTLQWITNTTDETYAEDSNSKGNYSGKIAVTSSNLNTSYAKNNIYDMAGNVFELTSENCEFDYNGELRDGAVHRGRVL